MDSLRGHFPEIDSASDGRDYDLGDEDTGIEVPPSPVGQDERRMQVRAYNFWAGLLDDRSFPSIEDLDPENLPDFGPYSVLLDFSSGIENPGIQYLGTRLAEECAGNGPIQSLSDVPARSLLSRITDHYMQILANQAPIGFEAEFVNQRTATVLYRGILLPFSSDDDTIDFIYGVINWKELADQSTADALLLEIDQSLDETPEAARPDVAPIDVTPITDWADGPGALDGALDDDESFDDDDDAVLDLVTPYEGSDESDAMPVPAFGITPEEEAVEDTDAAAGLFDAPDLSLFDEAPMIHAEVVHAEPLDQAGDEAGDPGMDLSDWLASARELAQAAKGSEDRSRQALYAAIGRAYDFSLAAVQAPEEFDELVTDSGLTAQDRAPMTPVVKLVFGADYDKTRLTEYASALGHAHRLGLARGTLSDFLGTAPGGLKGVVTAERRLRRAESGKGSDPRETPRDALARKLRAMDQYTLDDVPAEGPEFTLLVARRLADGTVVVLGEVADDVTLLEKAARKLVG